MPLPAGYTLDSPFKPPQYPGSETPPIFPGQMPPDLPANGPSMPGFSIYDQFAGNVHSGGGQPSAFDPSSGLWATPMAAGGGPTPKEPGDPTPTPPPPAPTPPPTTPTPVVHPPELPGVPVIPTRRHAVDPPPTAPTPPPTPPPATPLPPIGLPGMIVPGETGEDISTLVQRWRKGAIDAGETDLANRVTPFMVAFYRENNLQNLDPMTWMKTPGNLDAMERFIAANPQGAPVGSLGVGPLDQYHPVMPNHGPTGGTPPPAVVTPPATPTPPPTPPPGTPPPGTPTPPGTPPPGGAPPPDASKTPVDPVTGKPTTPDPNAEIQKLIDMFGKNFDSKQPGIETLLNPMYARQRQNLVGDMRADAAATGAIHSQGGFGENLATAESNLSGQQSADLAGRLSQEYIAKMQQNTTLAGLATQAGMQKFTAELDDQFKRVQLQSQDDLAKWLDTSDNVLKKYGIDTNDVLQRYITLTQSGDSRYSADQGVNAAALHAAAAQAAANAATEASKYDADIRRQLGLAGLGVDREKNIGDFILGLIQSGLAGINDINGILTGFPPTSIVVKP